jgi:hypothetical protein
MTPQANNRITDADLRKPNEVPLKKRYLKRWHDHF